MSNRPTYQRLCFTLLVSGIFAGWGFAQEDKSSKDVLNLSLEELMQIEVISSSKMPERMSEAPASVSVITREDIKRYRYRTVDEALRQVVGIYPSSDLNYDYLGVRGFSMPGDYNTRILVLIDGHKVNDAIYDMGLVGTLSPIDIESVERIEVVKGPGSAVWGSNALLATINIITRKGKDVDGGRVVTEVGSHNFRKGFIELGKGLENGLEVAGSVSGFETDGRNHIYFPELDYPDMNYGIADDLDGEEDVNGYLAASYDGFALEFTRNRREKQVPTAPWETVLGEDSYTVDGITTIEGSYETDLIESVEGRLLVRLYHDNAEYNGKYVYDYHDPILDINRDYAESKLWGSEIRYSMKPFPRLKATTGIEYQDAYSLAQRNWDEDPYYYVFADTDESFTLNSYYAQSELEIFESLQAVAGVRLDDYSTFGTAVTPRYGLIYTPFPLTALKLLYGEAFRAPNDFERNYYPIDEEVGPYDLQPEEGHTWELVWEQEIGRRMRMVSNLFHVGMEEIIVFTETTNGYYQYRNRDAASSEGIEWQIISRFDNGITSHVGFTLLRAEDDETGDRLTNSPKVMAAAGVSVPVLSKRLFVTPEVQFIGDRDTLSGKEVDSSALTNLTISTGKMVDHFEAAFSIYNIFDEDTYTPGGIEHRQNVLPQDGRTFHFKVSWSF